MVGDVAPSFAWYRTVVHAFVCSNQPGIETRAHRQRERKKRKMGSIRQLDTLCVRQGMYVQYGKLSGDGFLDT